MMIVVKYGDYKDYIIFENKFHQFGVRCPHIHKIIIHVCCILKPNGRALCYTIYIYTRDYTIECPPVVNKPHTFCLLISFVCI